MLSTVRRLDGNAVARSVRPSVPPAGAQVAPTLSPRRRRLLEASLPVDPLVAPSGSLPAIDLVAACHPRDTELLRRALDAAVSCSRNPIRTLWLATPDDAADSLADLVPDARVVPESELIPNHLRRRIIERFPVATQGWITQQVLKILQVLRSDAVASLVIDIDTLLLRPRVWLTGDGRQLLSPSWEFHPPYEAHSRAMWPGLGVASGLSYVTHHQLMQRDVLTAMYGSDGSGLTRWIDLADPTQSSAVSEYHCYGAFLTTQFPNRVEAAQWNNLAVPRSELGPSGDPFVEAQLRRRIDRARTCSISLHHYL